MGILIPYSRARSASDHRPIPYNRTSVRVLPSTVRDLQIIGPMQPLDAVSSTSVLTALSGIDAPLILTVLATDQGVEVGVRCAVRQELEVARAVRGAAPEWDMLESRLAVSEVGPLGLVGRLGPERRHDWAPLPDIASQGETEPLAAVLEAVQPLSPGEGLIIQYLIRPVDQTRRDAGWLAITQPVPPVNLAVLVEKLRGNGPRMPRFEPRLHRMLEDRLCQPAFEVIGSVAVRGSERSALVSRARSLSAAFSVNSGADHGTLALEDWSWRVCPSPVGIYWPRSVPSLYMTVGELAALWHLPSDRVRIAGVTRLKRPMLPLPYQIAQTQGLHLGNHRERGRLMSVQLPRCDLDAGHAVIVGRTGVGKTTEMHQIVRHIVAADDRPGLGIFDPHGELMLDFALRSIPPSREQDVVFLKMSDTDFPVGLPFFWKPPGVPEEAVVQTTFSILRLLFREHWSPTRMEDAVFALTATLSQLPSASLMDVPRLLTDASFRRRATAYLVDPASLEFWADFETLSEAGQREVARPILYRLRSFYRSPAVRNIVCQTRGLDFTELMEQGRILLVSLAGVAIQAEADLLGELIIARLHLAAMARLSRPRTERRPFYLAVDESQRFRGASLPIMLSEGRKLGLPLILSTQFIDAWGESLSESVLGNVGTLIAFRCGPTDSRRLAASLKPFTPDQLEDLDRYQAIVKLQVEGTTMPAFEMMTLPVTSPPNEAMLERIRARTRAQYCRPRLEVEKEIGAGRAKLQGSWEHFDVDEE